MIALVTPPIRPSWYANGPADLAQAEPGDRVLLYEVKKEDAARWSQAVYFAIVRGVQVSLG
jgi:hypothetical protein